MNPLWLCLIVPATFAVAFMLGVASGFRFGTIRAVRLMDEIMKDRRA